MCANPRRVRPEPRFALTSGIARRLKCASALGETAKEGSANSAADHLKVRSCLIDGEAVACDENRLAVFEQLRRERSGNRVFLYAFDLLQLDGEDLRREPLETRTATLASLLRRNLPGLRLNEHLAHDGESVFRHACKMGLEGIVSKRLGSRYRSGRSRDWLKIQEPGRSGGDAGGRGGLGLNPSVLQCSDLLPLRLACYRLDRPQLRFRT
jgi:ATP dependent DNA ligase-like protein